MNHKLERKILLNPGPATTSDSVKYAQLVPDICPREKEFGDLISSLRRDLLKVVNASEKLYTTVLFGGSGTAVMEAVISSVISPSNKLLILVNGAYGRRMCEIAETYSIPYDVLETNWTKPIDFEKATRIIEEKSIDTVAMVHHETTTGRLNPLEQFIQFKIRFGCALILDAISSYAGIHIDFQETPIDYLLSTSNKCLQGIPGVAFAICDKNKLVDLKNTPSKSYYLDLYNQYSALEEKQQTRFTPPVQTIYAMQAALRELIVEGFDARISRYENNWFKLRAGLENLGFQFLLEPEEESKILLTILEPTDSNYSFMKLHDLLYSEGFTIYPGKILDDQTFRLSIIGDLKYGDIHSFLENLEKALVTMQVQLFPLVYPVKPSRAS